MHLKLSFSLFICLIAGLTGQVASSWALDFPLPPANYVHDGARALSADELNRLFELLRAEDRRSGNQVLVATFDSLEGEDLVDYVNRLFKHWKPGQKDQNNGVLIAVFMKDRAIRIEVGYGLEPVLTDAWSKRIIEQMMIPHFRGGSPATGIYAGADGVVKVLEGKTDAIPAPSRQRARGRPIPQWSILFGLFFVFWVITKFERHLSLGSSGIRSGYRRRHWSGTSSSGSSSHWGGFGGGGGGFGGGGFSGGGGMSGGGGASGRW